MEANFKENYKKNTLEDFAISIFDKKELLNCSMDTLIVLASFWANRYEKALDSYANPLCTLIMCDKIPEIINSNTNRQIVNLIF